MMTTSSSVRSTLDAATQPVRIVRAGSARVDITPPPGYQTGGHGPEAVTARGYWGRLTATAFYFEDSERRGAVLASVDAFGVPSVLHQEVAKHFAARGVGISLERVLIAATHTHQGPANFFSVKAHNRHASKASGFDPALREFLRQRLIEAVQGAIDDADAHRTFSLEVVTGTVSPALFRSRAPRVFMRNANHDAMLTLWGRGIPASSEACQDLWLPGEPVNDWSIEGCPRLRSVDRAVSMLQLQRGGQIAAVAVFLAVHPTVLPASTPLFSQDVFGVARHVIEENGAIRHVAFFNGAEGDVTMRRTTRTAVDLIKLGRALGNEIGEITSRGERRQLGNGAATGRLAFASPGDALMSDTGEPIARLATRAIGGIAALGGAEDDWTWLRWLGFHSGPVKWPPDEQGVKIPAFGLINDVVFPQHVFSAKLPFSVWSIGDLNIAAVPFEMTGAVGFDVRKAIGMRPGRLEIVGLANEYGSYTASANEYDAQDYAGASTLWGPQQGRFTVELLRRLATADPGVTGSPPADNPGAEKTFGPLRLSDRPAVFRDLDRLVRSASLSRRPSHFLWCEPAPPALPAQTQRTVQIWHADGRLADAEMGLVVVLESRPRAGRARWAAIWVSPLASEFPGHYRFRVVHDGATPILSQLFAAGDSPPPACLR